MQSKLRKKPLRNPIPMEHIDEVISILDKAKAELRKVSKYLDDESKPFRITRNEHACLIQARNEVDDTVHCLGEIFDALRPPTEIEEWLEKEIKNDFSVDNKN